VSEPVRPRNKGDVPDDPLSRLRHSASHVMADAVRRIRPDAKVTIGPSIESGFYYDFDRPVPFTPEDLKLIEDKMKELSEAAQPFVQDLSTPSHPHHRANRRPATRRAGRREDHW